MNIFYCNCPLFLDFDVTNVSFLPGTLVQTPLGLAVQMPNGKFLSVQPNGTYAERDAVGGSYEIVTVDLGNSNLLKVTPGTEINQAATYCIPYHLA